MKTKQIPHIERDFNSFFVRERKRTLALLQSRYNLSEETAEDVYQDSCIALFQNIKNGKLVSLSSSLSTYFTQICINQSLKKIRDEKTFDSLDNGKYDITKVNELLGNEGFNVEQQQAMEDIINHLPPPCNVILWGYYYDNLSLAEIVNVIDFKNTDSVKAKKTQCIKKMKDRFSTQIKDIFYGED